VAQEIILECKDIHHWFGEDTRRTRRNNVLYDLNLKVVHGEIVALVGPSGCGKSTLLRAIVGTHPPRKGRVIVYPENGPKKGVTVRGATRRIGIVYQHYSLFPFLTAQQNVALGLLLDETTISLRLFHRIRWRALRKQHLQQAAELLDKLRLANAMNLYPAEMSGGMCQRVAVAQALIMKPEILLLDEPFGALDEATREELQRMLLTLYLENIQAQKDGQRPPYTIVIVTHELNEAIYVGDRVVGLSQYWNWEEKGHDRFPGATLVYDHVAPVYEPEQERDFEVFSEQRSNIRKAAFDPSFCQDAQEFRTFWGQVRDGRGKGVLHDAGADTDL